MTDSASQLISKAWNAIWAGDLTEALALINLAIQIELNDLSFLVTKAHVLRLLNRFNESEHILRTCIANSSTNYFAWTELGLLNRDNDEWEVAEFCFEKSLEQKADFNVYTLLASVQLLTDPSKALLSAEKALELKPGWAEAVEIRDRAKVRIEADNNRSGRV